MNSVRTLLMLTVLFAAAGCTSTISRQSLTELQARTMPEGSTYNGIPVRGNELWYMGTKSGYDYYYFYRREGSFDTTSTVRTPTANTGKEFEYTDNHTRWRQLYRPGRGGEIESPIITTGPAMKTAVPDLVIIDGRQYKLVPTTTPAAKDQP